MRIHSLLLLDVGMENKNLDGGYLYYPFLHSTVRILCTCNTYFIVTKSLFFDVGMEKEQKQEFGWRVSVLPIPAFHCILCTCNT